MSTRRLALAAIAMGTLAWSCSGILAPVPDPSRFYLLSPIANSSDNTAAAMPELSLGIGPVTLPDYVERPEIVVRTSPTQVRHSVIDQWAEPLGRNVTRVLSENLALLLGTSDVAAFPSFEVSHMQYQVRVAFLGFEQDAQHRALLSARWDIVHLDSKQLALSRYTTLTHPAVGDDVGSGVVALSAALGDLSREIAEAVRTLPK